MPKGMPASEEPAWDRAKEIVGDKYGGDKSSQHWAVVQTIKKNILAHPKVEAAKRRTK